MTSTATAFRDYQVRGGVLDLSPRLKLVLTGVDRVRYLHGQVTSDVKRLALGHTQPACVTTAKGRLCAEIMISATPAALFVDAEASLRASLPPRLERYLIADDVLLQECPSGTRLLHFLGQRPDWLGESESNDGLPGLQAATRFGRPGWDWWTNAPTLETRRPEIEKCRLFLDHALAEMLRIEAGVPRWGRELAEDTLPPEAGLERTHIDYHKGCYIGQEVISRLKSVGHVNRQLTGFAGAAATPLAPGPLFLPSEPARPVGVLTSTAYSFALEKPIALGYLRRGSPPGALLTARPADATGPEAVVTTRELPFIS